MADTFKDFHPIDGTPVLIGCVACEQVRAYDFAARGAELVESAPLDFRAKVATCVKSFF